MVKGVLPRAGGFHCGLYIIVETTKAVTLCVGTCVFWHFHDNHWIPFVLTVKFTIKHNKKGKKNMLFQKYLFICLNKKIDFKNTLKYMLKSHKCKIHNNYDHFHV